MTIQFHKMQGHGILVYEPFILKGYIIAKKTVA